MKLCTVAHTAVQGLSWTTDGYALAVQLDHQWALYSPFGDLVFRKRDHEPPIPNGKEKAHPSALGSESVTTRKGYKAPALVSGSRIVFLHLAKVTTSHSCFLLPRHGSLEITGCLCLVWMVSRSSRSQSSPGSRSCLFL